MNKISLSSVLILCLAIPFVMGYRISPGDTPYWLFGLIFLGLLSYLLLDISRISENIVYKLKQIILK